MGVFLVSFLDKISDVFGVIRNISFIDVLDIACVSVLLYYLFKFIRERRAGKLLVGVLLLFVAEIISSITDMYLLQYILQNIFQIGFITLVILFQPEIRSVLEKVGTQPLKSLTRIGDTKNSLGSRYIIDEITSAVFSLSESKTGALIVFERSTKLGDMILTGTVIDAHPTEFLIKNIFFNKAPLHDGALIVRDGRLYAAGCLLPLSNNTDIIKDLGTRHRAGIGMSENSDAVVVIVSEETGTVSTAIEGVLERGYSKTKLKRLLLSELEGADKSEKKRFPLFTKNHDKTEN